MTVDEPRADATREDARRPPGEPGPDNSERPDPDNSERPGPATSGEPVARPGEGPRDGRTATAAVASARVGEAADPFVAFAPVPPRPPSRYRRAAAALGRLLAHEWTLASLGGLVLAALLTWPTLRYPRHTLPQDIYDPALQAWQMAWSGHALRTDPGQLWHANAFHPERYSFAFSDTLLGYAPAGLLGAGPEAALLRYNVMYVLVHALAFVGAYALVRQLGSGRTGAAVAGVAFAYAPWRMAQAGHLHILSSGGIALALAMLARGHGWSLRHGVRPERRHAGWAFAGWAVAAWQLSLGFGIGLPFAYALGGISVVAAAGWLRHRLRRRAPRRRLGWRLPVADLAGGLLFAAVGVLLARPYFLVAELHPYARRSVDELRMYSPPWQGLLIAPEESRLWGAAHADARAGLSWVPEMTLLPGFALYALAAAGLFFSVWTVRQRLLLLAGVVATAALALGTEFLGGRFTYLPLYRVLPGWDALRTPGRLMLWTTLLLGVLAAGAVTAFVARARSSVAHRRPVGLGALRPITLVPLALVLLEGLNATPHPVVPPRPAALTGAAGPLLVLPSDSEIDNRVMLWSTAGFPPLVNGNSGFTPHRLAEVRRVSQSFPDPGSVAHLRELGVRSVVVLRDEIAGTPWQEVPDRPVDGLGVTRRDEGPAVVFELPG